MRRVQASRPARFGRSGYDSGMERQPRVDEILGRQARTTSRGRTLAPMDVGAVALAISGMTFYWIAPMVLARRRRRRDSAPGAQAQ
jgi:hypothetical protein